MSTNLQFVGRESNPGCQLLSHRPHIESLENRTQKTTTAFSSKLQNSNGSRQTLRDSWPLYVRVFRFPAPVPFLCMANSGTTKHRYPLSRFTSNTLQWRKRMTKELKELAQTLLRFNTPRWCTADFLVSLYVYSKSIGNLSVQIQKSKKRSSKIKEVILLLMKEFPRLT